MIEYHLTHAEYAARPGVNSTVIKAGRMSMRHARHTATQPRVDTPSLSWGRHIHTAILEPAKIADRVAVWTGGRRASKAFEEFAAQHAGRDIILPGEMAELMAISASAWANPHAADLLRHAHVEASVFWDEPQVGPSKARPDAFAPGVPLVDVKSARNISPRACERQFYDLGYALQLGWYVRGLRACEVYTSDATIIAVESGPPYDVAVYELDADYLKWGEQEAVRLAKQYAACCAANKWPGVCPDARTLFPPAYAADEVASVPPAASVAGGMGDDPF